MKKLTLAFAVLMIITTSAKAQDKMSSSNKTTFGIAINGGIPTNKAYTIIFGADLQADIAATEGLKITASVGYENYSVKTALGGGHFSVIPLLAGAKFNLSSNLYGHAQLGYAFSTTSGGGGLFAYAPSLGYMFSPNLDLSIKYLGLSNHGSLGAVLARLAYNF